MGGVRGQPHIMLWADKYRPNTFDDLTFSPELTERLRKLTTPKHSAAEDSSAVDIPHLLFYGAEGSGRKTRIGCVLNALYGTQAASLHAEEMTFTPTGSATALTVPFLSSRVHHEINASSLGRQDRFVVQQLIKQIADSAPVMGQAQPYRMIVLHDADYLTLDAQNALRRTMESCSAECRMILIATSLTRVTAPIRSRCLCIRVPSPSSEEIQGVVSQVLASEGIRCSDRNLELISRSAGRNCRRAILAAEATWVAICSKQGLSDSEKQKNVLEDTDPSKLRVVTPEWEIYCDDLVASLFVPSKGAASIITQARSRVYEMLSRAIPPPVIFQRLLRGIIANPACSSMEKASKICDWCSIYEARSFNGQHPIMHIEAFIARVLEVLYAS